MKKIPFLFFSFLLGFVSQRAFSQDWEFSDSGIKSILRDCVEKQKRAPGIVVGLIDASGGKVIGFGTTERGLTNGVNGDTVFEIGSVTKTFTSLLLAKMIERGEMALDDPAGKFLPASVKLSSRNSKEITLRHLATHTSGLPRMPTNFQARDPENPHADYTVEQMYEFLRGCKLNAEPGESYDYSNLGVGLLGHILALKAGTNYEALVLREICEPLKMPDTRIAFTPGMKARLAHGHNSAGVPVKNWDIPLAGAGAIRSTANDMLKYLAANIGLTETSLSAAMEKTHVPRHDARAPDTQIGLGWHLRQRFGSTFIWHNGATGGYHTFAGFEKKKRRGIIVLANSANDIDDIGWHLLNSKFELLDVHPRQVAKVNYEAYDDYVGRYRLGLGGQFVITRDGNRLLAKLANQPTVEVYPESEGKFFYVHVDAQLTFVRDQNGAVTHLVLHQNGIDQKATKVK